MEQHSLANQVLAADLQELALLREEMQRLARQLETEVLVMMLDRLLIDQAAARSSAHRAAAHAPRQAWPGA